MSNAMTWRCTACGFLYQGATPPESCPVCGVASKYFEAHEDASSGAPAASSGPSASGPTADAWRCQVCGYVHRGSEPPEECPVCGVGREMFEPHEDPACEAPAAPTATRWRCLVCGFEHEGAEPPASCPVCAAAADLFEKIADAPSAAITSGHGMRVVVVGAGIAGVSAVEAISELTPDAAITLLSREATPPYYRLNLTRFLAGEIGEESLPIHPQSWYGERKIDLRLGVEAAGLDLPGRTVQTNDGESIPYDRLLLATGSHPFIPPVDGASLPGVFSLRTVDDAKRILKAAEQCKKCAVIGGGVLGLEAAVGLARRGVDVTLLESYGWLMPRQLNETAGRMLEEHVEQLGVKVRRNVRTKRLLGDDRLAGVEAEDGAVFECDLAVIATGVRSTSYLARQAGLHVERGVVVDDTLATSDPNVFAAGDAAEHAGVVYGTWPPSQFQGTIAGRNIAGHRTEFGGMPPSNTLKVLGVHMFSVGCISIPDGSYRQVDERDGDDYRMFLFQDNRLVGAILLGDTSLTRQVTSAIEHRADCSKLLHADTTSAAVVDRLQEL